MSTTAAREPMSNGPGLPSSSAAHIGYMDGIRGLAALYVLAGHVAGEIASRPGSDALPVWLLAICRSFTLSHFVVAVFIVLSGYVLMMPVAQSADGALRGGLASYVKRRFLRIVPAYYAALALSAAIVIWTPHLASGIGSDWDRSVPALTHKAIFTHLFLLHNLFWDSIYKLDGPAWTVATEWQIYFLLPLILLPAWRKWGLGGLMATGACLGYAPHFLFNARFEEACPHFIFLFTLGMTAAVLNHNTEVRADSRYGNTRWSAAAMAFGGIALMANCLAPHWTYRHYYLVEIPLGMGVLCFMVYATRLMERRETRPPAVLRVLNSRVALWLGAFSYSLYLIHYPIVGGVDAVLLSHHVSPPVSAAILVSLIVVVPLVAYGFFVIFERPFLARKSNLSSRIASAYSLPPVA
jgi:peptidoglycan/LPS O-acetylase OafA/YrhL